MKTRKNDHSGTEPTDEIEGFLERIRYSNEESGFTVARLTPSEPVDGNRSTVTVVGPMLDPREGEKLLLRGQWVFHPRFGKQFRFSEYRIIPPSTETGIRKFLGSGIVRGIGPSTADRMVDAFGADTLKIFDEDPRRLLELRGIGRKRLKMIVDSWVERREIKDVMMFLQVNGISTGYAFKIYRTYGQSAIEIVRKNPYRLCEDIWGIGFLTADRIAMGMGIQPDSPLRLQAGVLYYLNQAADQGHVFLPFDNLLNLCGDQLNVDAGLVNKALETLRDEEKVFIDEGRVYNMMFYRVEETIAFMLRELLSTPGKNFSPEDVDEKIAGIERARKMSFNEKQREAIQYAVSAKLMILTGGPGTGKTTTSLGILDLLASEGREVRLAAPTGRAAQRLSETTNRPAKTLHRMLRFNPITQRFEHDRKNPLVADVVLVDEASMIDIFLMHALLTAIRPDTTLILVGDVDQLPSVGPGNVLKDIISSGLGQVIRLVEIFRQARASHIVLNAHRINRGDFPVLKNDSDSDFFFIRQEDPSAIPGTIVELCTSRLPRFYGFEPVNDIQVLSPMYKGDAGANNLNALLQEALNPHGRPFQIRSREFREGDKVMQIKNNYQKQVFNGDIGRILFIDPQERTLTVRFGLIQTEYTFEETEELVLAYAVSVHKSQGSEYRAVILPVTTQHYIMLQRNLLYTAITRAKKLVVLVGTKQAIGIAARNDRVAVRYTALKERLLSSSPPSITFKEK